MVYKLSWTVKILRQIIKNQPIETINKKKKHDKANW